jgi:ligand-binding SRPBCC domain-containing protein
MKYEHRFRVRASLAAVADFHSHASSMPSITPPPLIVQLQSAPQTLGDGDRMDFTMWAGPLPVRWEAQIEDVSERGFTDRQLRGPFGEWRHRHSFNPLADDLTEVVDQVEASVQKHVLWGLVGITMWIGLPLLFAYRGWRTRRLLEGGWRFAVAHPVE